ncbi:YigZ family protein [Rhodococcus sp. Eu-32]|nr:YigZ family protein [Rhodococcus sp. Eu-32]
MPRSTANSTTNRPRRVLCSTARRNGVVVVRTVASAVRAEVEIKKSRFIAIVARAASETEARAVIASRRSAEPAARHHCSAFVYGDVHRVERSSDDGEPGGTAGTPMLDVLRGHDLTNVVAVVTRYFGGTKLGTGGLTRAYGGAVAEALGGASFLYRHRRTLMRIELPHTDAGRVESELRRRDVEIVSVEYGASAMLTVAVADTADFDATLADLTAGTVTSERLGETYVETSAP